MSKRIVIDARESGTSTGRYIDKLIEHMEGLPHDHQIIILAKAERLKYLGTIAPSFTIVETPFPEFTFAEQIGFLRQLNGLEADLVHFGIVQQPVLYRGKVVTTMHDLTTVRFKNPSKNPIVFWVKQLVYKWVNIVVARKSIAIMTPTQFVKDDIVAFTGVKPDKITVTYESGDAITEAPEPVTGLEGKQFIMYVGRPTPHKNLPRLIEAYALLKETHPQLKLVLAGKKDVLYEQIEQRAVAKGIKDIVFTGFISEGQLRWLYEQTAAYAFPSLSEGFGLPPLEAMHHGAPVVSSNATCLPEVYGEAAHYFNPLEVPDMAAKIGEVLDNPELREKLVAAGKTQVAKYSWTRMAQQTLAIYEKALGK